MSNLYVTFWKRQAAALHEQLVRYFSKTPSSSSSWATSASVMTLSKAPSSSSSRTTSASFYFSESNKQQTLHELPVRYYFCSENSKRQLLYLSNLYVIGIFFGRQQAAASLFEQLVCYRYFLWTTTDGSFLYVNNHRIYSLITSALMSIPLKSRRESLLRIYTSRSR